MSKEAYTMKQMESREVVVGENTFYIRPLPAFKAANMSGELGTMLLPLMAGLTPLLGLVDTGEEGKGLLDIDLKDAVPAISGAFSSISGDKLEAILKHLLIAGKNIAVELPDAEKPKILTEDLANEIFCEDIQDMFILAFEVIRTNYNGFFRKFAARFGPLIEALKKKAAEMQQNMAPLT